MRSRDCQSTPCVLHAMLGSMLKRAGRLSLGLLACAVACCACGTSPPTANRDIAATVPSKASTVDSTTSTVAPSEPVRSFTVRPTDVTVGKPVTFSGTGCPHPDLVNVGFGGGSTTLGTTAEHLRPDSAGAWTVTTRVGDSTPLGPQGVRASCLPPPYNAVGAFDYPSLVVVVETFRGLRVTPTSASAGSAITVTPTAPCDRGFPAGIRVQLARSPGNIFIDNTRTLSGSSAISTSPETGCSRSSYRRTQSPAPTTWTPRAPGRAARTTRSTPPLRSK